MNDIILTDDTIEIIKKICANIETTPFMKSPSYLIPSRIYLYTRKGKNKIPIGHNWRYKNNQWDFYHVSPKNSLYLYYSKNNYSDTVINYFKLNYLVYTDTNDNILYDFKDEMIFNEIYMIDIYHEIKEIATIDITKEQEMNFHIAYLKLYFPQVKQEQYQNILDYVSNKSQGKKEYDFVEGVHNVITNDLILYNQSIRIIRDIQCNNDYKKYLKSINIIQGILKKDTELSLRGIKNTDLSKDRKIIDLYLIFDSFKLSKKYPFIHYQKKQNYDRNVKLYEYLDTDTKELAKKWFDSKPIGISIKLFLQNYNKYMTVNIYETGKIEYKTQWKETNNITINDIKETLDNVTSLIQYINKCVGKKVIKVPSKEEFVFEFINANLIFHLPKIINHKVFISFANNFFSYINTVFKKIPPAQEKNKEYILKQTSQLIYKRTSRYHTNLQNRKDNFIIYIIKNYQQNTPEFNKIISERLNIDEKEVPKKVEEIKIKYPNILTAKKKVSKLKDIEDAPKYRNPGIKLDLQWKVGNLYTIRIQGSKNKFQLLNIINFVSTLMFLYTEIFLSNKNKYQWVVKTLKNITEIASKREQLHKEINLEGTGKSNIKNLAELDKQRFGFTPKKGKSNYSRMCLKEFQPQGYPEDQLDKLVESGYEFDEKTNRYIMKSEVTKKKQ